MASPQVTGTPSTENKASALALFMKSLEGQAKPNKTDQKAAGAAFKAFQAKKQAAIKALKELELEETEVSKACIRAFGKVKLTVDGKDFVPTARDERIYYKEMSGGGVEL
jgi:hypothetical protein